MIRPLPAATCVLPPEPAHHRPRPTKRTARLDSRHTNFNRLTSKLGTATDSYSYPATSNQLSLITLAAGGTRGFTYDGAGNVVSEARPGGTYSYTYDAAGRMAEFRINGILQASYKYDAMGRQAIRTLSSPTAVTIHSVFDSEGRRIAEYDEASGALIREYAWLGWDPIAVIEGGTISFVRADHIGRPVFATNSTGTKVWTATYNPFGGVHTSTGTLPNNRFPGQWFQSESGLHQNWMRDYDPTTGRYLQADPLGLIDGASVYGYAGQNPERYTDPTGQCIGPFIAWAPACAAAAWAAISVYIGWLLDPDCYTWEEMGWNAALGAAGGPFGAYGRAGAAGASAAVGVTKSGPLVNAGKQGKHIPGSNNYIPGRSVVTADPQALAQRAGTGVPVNSIPRGQPGFKERVDFGKVIGDYVTNGKATPTSRGIIVYDKAGTVHIIPSRPN